MNIEQTAVSQEQQMIEYVAVEDGLNILDEIFNKLFEQVEKEIVWRIEQIRIDNYLQITNNGDYNGWL